MKKLLFAAVILASVSTGCKKNYLDTVPSTSVTEEQIFADVTTVNAAVSSVYKENFEFSVGATTGRHDAFGIAGYGLSMDLMGNDMIIYSQGYNWFNSVYTLVEWTRATINNQPDLAWYLFYDLIGQCNRILDVIDVVPGTQAEIDNIKGQMLGMRGISYYYLVNLFQQTYKGHETSPGVPIPITYNTPDEGRNTVQDVYDRITSDLDQAEVLLDGKPRVNKAAVDVSTVRGFRARVALIMEDWATAATKANQARQGYGLMSAAQYPQRGTFASVNNPEAIWGAIITEAEATVYASFFSHLDVSSEGYAFFGQQKLITKDLYDRIPQGDVRKTVFIAPGTGSAPYVDYNQMKLTLANSPDSWEGDYIYMRSAEMYLIEAEALARQGQESSAKSVLEQMVTTRFPGYSAAGFSGTALVDEILLQRRIELWGEGFALWDIKRLNQGLNRPTGPGNHGTPYYEPNVYTTQPADRRFIMQLPNREMDVNPMLTPLDQNP